MSILNAWVSAERAVVGVDTAASIAAVASPGRSEGASHATKLLPLAHLNAIVAIRGNATFLATLAAILLMHPLRDGDQLLEALPGVLPAAFQALIAAMRANGHDTADAATSAALAQQEIVLVAWSPSRRRFLGREYVQQDPARGFVADEIAPEYSAPWDPSLPPHPDFSNRVTMTAYARLQVKLLREKAPGVAAGGRFIVTELRPGRIQIDVSEL